MTKRIVILTSGTGSLIEIAFKFQFFKDAIVLVVVDRVCGAMAVATKNQCRCILLETRNSQEYSDKLLQCLDEIRADYVLSYSNLKILKGGILEKYRNRIFNSHFSILPGFKGFYYPGESQGEIPPRKIFERTIEFGSRVCGNTIHIVSEEIDSGKPILVGIINIPFAEEPKITRHRLFEVEVKTFLQVTSWLCQDRLTVTNEGVVNLTHAKFEEVGFSPNLDLAELKELTLKSPG
jgi:phosphoribosylglycinamide formyltransferase 1